MCLSSFVVRELKLEKKATSWGGRTGSYDRRQFFFISQAVDIAKWPYYHEASLQIALDSTDYQPITRH